MKKKLLLSVLVLFLSTFLLSACGSKPLTWELNYKRALIATLDVRSGVEQGFFLGIRQSDGATYYVFTESTEDGGSYVRTVRAGNLVYYQDVLDGQPYVKYFQCSGFSNLTYCNTYSAEVPEALRGWIMSDWYEIHMPPDAIVTILN